jgi:hypothetical protein
MRATDYGLWNPEILAGDGHLSARQCMTRRVALAVTAFAPPSFVVWTGGLPFGLFVGRRTLTVLAHDGSLFRMELSMTGPLAPLILKSQGDRQPDIDAFSACPKRYAERRHK